MPLNFIAARDLLNAFEFRTLFVEQLGWSNPPSPKPVAMNIKGTPITRRQIADLSGVGVYEIESPTIPDAKIRAELDAQIAHLYGLTEPEFTHILSTFPLVPQETKDAALAEFRKS